MAVVIAIMEIAELFRTFSIAMKVEMKRAKATAGVVSMRMRFSKA
jgi:hypothetical protein